MYNLGLKLYIFLVKYSDKQRWNTLTGIMNTKEFYWFVYDMASFFYCLTFSSWQFDFKKPDIYSGLCKKNYIFKKFRMSIFIKRNHSWVFRLILPIKFNWMKATFFSTKIKNGYFLTSTLRSFLNQFFWNLKYKKINSLWIYFSDLIFYFQFNIEDIYQFV